MSATQTLLQIFTEPEKAMATVRERSMVLLPLALLIVGTAAVLFWYYQIVDIEWLQDQMFSANPNPNMDAAAMEAARGFMTRGVMSGMAVVSVAIMVPLMLVLTAVYYLLAAKVIGNDIGFGKWFAFSTWSAVPTLLIIPAMAVQILMADNGQLSPDQLNALSLNQLIFHEPMSSAWNGLLNAISLPSIWAIVVAVIGYRNWTSKGTGASAFIVLLPQIVIYGIWAAVAAMRSGA